MGLLRVSLFGSVTVRHDDVPYQVKLTPVIQELLAYLLLNSRYPQPRDVLAEQFWGEYSQEKARGCLKTALWRLRRVLEPEGIPGGTYLLSNQQGEISFNHDSPHWVDVKMFLDQVNPILNCPSPQIGGAEAAACSEALTLYTGDLLAGFYDDWAIRQREHLRMVYLDALTRLVQHHKEQGQYEKSLEYARKILEIDPLREEIHREVMRLCLESGQRPQALQQFEACQAVLQRELGIAPMDETQQLHRAILASGAIPVTGARPPEADIVAAALTQLQSARLALAQAQDQFRKAAQMLEGLLSREK